MNKIPALAALAVLFIGRILAADSNAPALYLDPNQPVDQRVADLISRLTLEQKAALLNHKGSTVTVSGRPIRSDQWNQCLNGVQWDRPTTLFPVCVAMAATWNTDLVQNQIARVLSDEARAIYNGWHLDPNAKGQHKGLIYRAPVINIERNPYWGRNHEAFGEDPFLTGRMAVAYVRGIQGDNANHLKLAATLKHYAVNNVEVDRMKLDAKVSERMLREYWLPHFRDAVVEGEVQSLMASYNAINGTPNNINHWLLTDLLKHEWKHKGFVVSDLGGVKTMVEGHEQGKMTYVDAVAKSLMAGCDFSDKEFEQYIPAAVREGKLTEKRLNDALTRVLRTRFRLGEFDPFDAGPYSKISPNVINSPAHRAIALEAARQSIVLLQNHKQTLPLDRTKMKRIAVVGPLAERVVRNNYNGHHIDLVTPLQGIRNRAGTAIEVVYASGGNVGGMGTTRIDHEIGFSDGASVKLQAGLVGDFIEFQIEVKEPGTYRLILQFKSYPDRGIFQTSIDGENLGKPVDMFGTSPRFGLQEELGEKQLSAGRHNIRFSVAGKAATSRGLSGHFDKLTLVGAKQVELELEKAKFVTGRASDSQNPIQIAAELARGADAAIVFVGTDESVEQEGLDRTSLGLPGEQEALVKAVRAANPRTIVVLKSAGPLTVPWLKKNVSAMLQAWWGGEEDGNAIADVLFGNVNPAGRLPHTVYASAAQVPSLDEYDITKGFTYMYVKGEPLYSFGHGLSYTKFKYSGLKLSAAKVNAAGGIIINVDVTNTGKRAGDEVVQLYVHQTKSSVKRPVKELRGFERISLKPGERKIVAFMLPAEKLAFWAEASHGFVVEPGSYDVMIGTSSSDIRVKDRLEISD
jgi:beta-glucosidase